jgi:hypothetical protein
MPWCSEITKTACTVILNPATSQPVDIINEICPVGERAPCGARIPDVF